MQRKRMARKRLKKKEEKKGHSRERERSILTRHTVCMGGSPVDEERRNRADKSNNRRAKKI
jgi:hypothetical protein